MKIYICEKYGDYYWLEDGILVGVPMVKGDSLIDLEEDSFEIDLDVLDDTCKKDLIKIKDLLQ